MANIYEIEGPGGQIIEIEGDRPPTRAEADRAFSMAAQPSMGELRRREGSGEISATIPDDGGFSEPDVRKVRGGGLTPPEVQALKEFAPMVVSVMAPEILPVKMLAGPGAGLIQQLARSGLEGLLSGTAFQAATEAPEVISGDKSVSEAVSESILPVAGMTAAGPLLYGALRGAGSVIKGTAEKLAGGRGFKTAMANLFRPVELTQDQLNSIRARQFIRDNTGQMIPIGLAEATGLTPSSLRQIQAAGNEITDEQLRPLADAALHAAANTGRSGRTTEEIANSVFDVLDPQRTGINDRVRTAVNQFARRAVNAVNDTERSISSSAGVMFPPGRSVATIGGELGDMAYGALNRSQEVWDRAFEAFRSHPLFSTIRVPIRQFRDTADRLGVQLVPNGTGGYSAMNSSGARRAVEAAQDIPDEITLDQAQKLASQLGKEIRNPGVLPGIDIHFKAQLADEARAAVVRALEPHPELSGLLRDANRLYAENIARFRGSFAEGILKDVGEEGGALPEAIVSSLTGKSAETRFNQFMELLGQGATAGTSSAPRGAALIREAIMSTAARTGRMGGGVNVGEMFRVIEKIPDNVRNQLFPNFRQMRQLMLNEAALGRTGQSTRNAETFLETLNLKPADLQAAFSASDLSSLEMVARHSVREQAQAAAELSSLGLNELATRSTFDLKRFVTDPGNLDKTRNLVTRLTRDNPEALADVRTLFVDDLLTQATEGGVLNPDRLRELLRPPMASAAGGGVGPGTAGRSSGKFSEVSDALLGRQQREALSEIANNLGEINTANDIQLSAGKSWWNTLIFGYQGGNIAQGTRNSVVNFLGRLTTEAKDLRYMFASAVLTDARLRELAMQPIGNVQVRDMNRLVRLVTTAVREKYGKDSDMYRQVQAVDAALPDQP